VNESSCNDIPVLSYKLHFRLTSIIHNEWGVIVLVVIATALEMELKKNSIQFYSSFLVKLLT
jgi:hypothetical protein